jgi:pyruvate carboxylase
MQESTRTELCESALRLARAAHYSHAGTVEYLYDVDTGKYYFIGSFVESTVIFQAIAKFSLPQ